MLTSELIDLLATQAKEIATEGHAGWGNTMTEAAETLRKYEVTIYDIYNHNEAARAAVARLCEGVKMVKLVDGGELAAALEREERLRQAIEWALGARGEFEQRSEVDTGATGTATGLDWANPYPKLSAAITAEKAVRANKDGAYWWRKELQQLAGLKWDGEKFIDV